MLFGGPPTPVRTLWDVFERTVAAYPHAPAVDAVNGRLDYRQLRCAVERLAERLRVDGVGRGDRVGVRVPSGTVELYVAILAILRTGAAYVPVDVDDPPERADLVFTEASVCAVVGERGRIVAGPVRSRRIPGTGPRPGDDAWVIFTSGSTGTPKGVAVTHRSAAAFVDAEARLFLPERPLGPGDRVLAGLSVAFDASCEEMWLAWRSGACLVPARRSLVRSGAEFGDWLVRSGISVVSTVPTLAGLWTAEQLRGVRLMILGGEACPEALAHRLARVCPEVWNTYGPTEATVVACAARLSADGPVRIGLPLAGWLLAVVDPETQTPVPPGEVGELVISGVGTARYLDLDKDRSQFRALPALRWRRAYRSGDLVRAEPDGLSFLGRADGQVKIRGYRIELSEIEAVLADLPGVAQAAVSTHEVRPSVTELVAYYSPEPGVEVDERELSAGLRARLPPQMVPAFLERLPAIPTSTSGKVDRRALPAPTTRRGTGAAAVVPPATPTEAVLAALASEILGVDAVSVESHFFDDLGAGSLAMAQFAARVREHDELPSSLGMRQLYQHPTVRSLAGVLDEAGAAALHPGPGPAAAHVPAGQAPPPAASRYVVCGLLQLVVLVAMLAAGSLVAWADVGWMDAATGALDLALRSAGAFAATFALLGAVPVAAKWVLIGRWRPAEIPIWSLAYLRFWTVATLIRTSPLVLFAGSPIYLLYLRALGARIGRGVVVFSRTVPICTDLLEIGDDTVVRKRSSFTGYHAHDGTIRTGRVEIGSGAVVAESTHLGIDTAVGDHAQLGHASSLAAGQRVPDHQSWHGSPAVPAGVDYRTVPPARCSRSRRAAFAVLQLVNLLLVGPALFTLAVELLDPGPRVTGVLDGLGPGELLAACLSLPGVALSLGGCGAVLVGALVVVVVAPRALRATLRPGRVYPLYGAAYWSYRTISRISNVPFFVQLYGDSSYIVGYLRMVGYRIARGGQTGSNFGADLGHEVPHLVSVGPNTMVSDGVAFQTAEFTNSSFRVAPVSLGADCFLGNVVSVPAGGRVGDDCLVGTKTMIPLDGPVRQHVGLLGSPPFEISRARHGDPRFEITGAELRRSLRAKNRHNLRTMALFLLVQWIRLHLLLTVGLVAAGFYATAGPAAIALGTLAAGATDLVWSALVERAVTGFRGLRPQYCSIYDPYFWWHERFWKLSIQPSVLNGTPFKPLLWRALGVDVGRRVFDDGASISEKTLVRIGDGATLNGGVILQAHSMEDGIFKSDRIDIGSRCTLGTGAFVHYDTVVGDGAALGADSFLMKGERVAAGSVWIGNPAHPVDAPSAAARKRGVPIRRRPACASPLDHAR